MNNILGKMRSIFPFFSVVPVTQASVLALALGGCRGACGRGCKLWCAGSSGQSQRDCIAITPTFQHTMCASRNYPMIAIRAPWRARSRVDAMMNMIPWRGLRHEAYHVEAMVEPLPRVISWIRI